MEPVTIRRRTWRWHVGLWTLYVAVLVAFAGRQVYSLVGGTTGSTGWPSAVLPVVLIAQFVLLPREPLTLRLSDDGVRWRGFGWRAERPWTDFEVVGGADLSRPTAGAITARLKPDAPGPSDRRYPRRLSLGRRGTVLHCIVVPLTQPTYGQTWDRSDHEVVALVRERVGDRWSDDVRVPA